MPSVVEPPRSDLKRKRNFEVVIPIRKTTIIETDAEPLSTPPLALTLAATPAPPPSKHRKFTGNDPVKDEQEIIASLPKKVALEEYSSEDDDDDEPEAVRTMDSRAKILAEEEAASKKRQLEEAQLKQKRRETDAKLKAQKAESTKNTVPTSATTEDKEEPATSTPVLEILTEMQPRSRLLPTSLLTRASNRDKSPSPPRYSPASSRTLSLHSSNALHIPQPLKQTYHKKGPVYVKILEDDSQRRRILAPAANKNSKSIKDVWRNNGRNVEPVRKAFSRC